MKIKLIEKANPSDRTKVKLYASSINAGKKDFRAIARDMADRSSFTYGDIENVLANFLDELPKYLNDGYSIQIGYFGTMRVSLSSEGVEDAKKFKTETIRPKIIFTPGIGLKQALTEISYEMQKP